MTKRQLDKQEKLLTLKGAATIKDRIKRLKESINFNELTLEFQKKQDEYQDTIRPYMKARKKEEDDKILGTLNQNLAMEQDNYNNLQDQLNHGVEIKNKEAK